MRFASFAAVNCNRSQIKASQPSGRAFDFGFYFNFSYWPTGRLRLR